MKRLPVEWNNIQIMKGEEPTYGCIVGANDKVQVQGSNAGALADDLNRQFTALAAWLNTPGSFTGTFGEALELMKKLAIELATTGTIDKNDPKLIQFKSVCKAVKKGTTDWKNSVEVVFGKPSLLPEINDLYTQIDVATSQLISVLDCNPTGFLLPKKRNGLNENPVFYAKIDKLLNVDSPISNNQFVLFLCNFAGTQTSAQALVNGFDLVEKLQKILINDTFSSITDAGKTYSCLNGTKAIIDFGNASVDRTTGINPPIYTINNKKYQCFWSGNTVFGYFEVSKLAAIKGKENALNLKKIGSYTPYTVISYEPNSPSCKLKADDFDPNSQGLYFTEIGLNQLKNKLNGQGANNTEIAVKDCADPTKATKTVTKTSTSATAGQKPIQIVMCWDGKKWQLTHKFQTGALSIPSAYKGSVAEVEAKSNDVADRVKEIGLKASSYDDELVYKDLDIIQALVEVKEATLTLCNQAKVPEKYWDDANSPIKAPTLSGVGDGAIAELKDIPELVGFGLQLATEPETAKGIWNGIKSMTPAKVKKMLLGAASEKLAKYAEGGNTMKHEAGKDGVQAAMFVFGGVGKIKDGAELIDDLGAEVVDKLDNIAEESLNEISGAIEEIGGKSFNKALKEAEIDNFVAESYASTVSDVAKTKGRKLTWEEVKALFKRGNDFNRKALVKYDLNEVVLSTKKRLDSYIPGKEIISRKATTLSEIKFATFENYLKEFTTKYKKGTVINSSKTSGVLSGKYMLEIPTSNKTFAKMAEYEKFALDNYGVTIKYLDE